MYGRLTAAVPQVRQYSPDLKHGLRVSPGNPSLLLVHSSFVAELRGVSHGGHESDLGTGRERGGAEETVGDGSDMNGKIGYTRAGLRRH